jgi:hypothetical protein
MDYPSDAILPKLMARVEGFDSLEAVADLIVLSGRLSQVGQPGLASDPGAESLRWASHTLGNTGTDRGQSMSDGPWLPRNRPMNQLLRTSPDKWYVPAVQFPSMSTP